jgi:hypothetical protein
MSAIEQQAHHVGFHRPLEHQPAVTGNKQRLDQDPGISALRHRSDTLCVDPKASKLVSVSFPQEFPAFWQLLDASIATILIVVLWHVRSLFWG